MNIKFNSATEALEWRAKHTPPERLERTRKYLEKLLPEMMADMASMVGDHKTNVTADTTQPNGKTAD